MAKYSKLIRMAREHVHLPFDAGCKQAHFSFILVHSNVLSFGYNQAYKTHPLAKKFKHRFNAIHSELDAIRKFPFAISMLHKCSIVNVRIKKDGSVGNSRPCQSCCRMLEAFGFKNVFHTSGIGETVVRHS